MCVGSGTSPGSAGSHSCCSCDASRMWLSTISRGSVCGPRGTHAHASGV
jgi:hypothetical protein